MSAKPKPVDPYAQMDGPVVSRQLLDDLTGVDPSPEAQAWLDRAMAEIDDDPEGFASADEVMAGLRAMIDEIESGRGG